MTTHQQPAPALLAIKKGLENGEIRTFKELFRICPQAALANQLDIAPSRLAALAADPGEFTYNEMIRLSRLLQVDLSIIHHFIIIQINLAGPAGPASAGA